MNIAEPTTWIVRRGQRVIASAPAMSRAAPTRTRAATAATSSASRRGVETGGRDPGLNPSSLLQNVVRHARPRRFDRFAVLRQVAT